MCSRTNSPCNSPKGACEDRRLYISHVVSDSIFLRKKENHTLQASWQPRENVLTDARMEAFDLHSLVFLHKLAFHPFPFSSCLGDLNSIMGLLNLRLNNTHMIFLVNYWLWDWMSELLHDICQSHWFPWWMGNY